MSIVIVASSLAPAMDALRAGAAVASEQRRLVINRQRLVTRMEQVAASSFATLDADAAATGNSPTTPSVVHSDPAGTADGIVVMLYRYSVTSATTSDTGLVRIDASMQGTALSLSTLRVR